MEEESVWVAMQEHCAKANQEGNVLMITIGNTIDHTSHNESHLVLVNHVEVISFNATMLNGSLQKKDKKEIYRPACCCAAGKNTFLVKY